MKDQTILIGGKTSVDAAVHLLGVINVKSILSHLSTSLRERERGGSLPLNIRGGVSKELTL